MKAGNSSWWQLTCVETRTMLYFSFDRAEEAHPYPFSLFHIQNQRVAFTPQTRSASEYGLFINGKYISSVVYGLKFSHYFCPDEDWSTQLKCWQDFPISKVGIREPFFPSMQDSTENQQLRAYSYFHRLLRQPSALVSYDPKKLGYVGESAGRHYTLWQGYGYIATKF